MEIIHFGMLFGFRWEIGFGIAGKAGSHRKLSSKKTGA
jgi:hypothetical protein